MIPAFPHFPMAKPPLICSLSLRSSCLSSPVLGQHRVPPRLAMYRVYVHFAHTLIIGYERNKSDVLWFLLDAAYLDSPSKRVIFPRVEVYCQIEVALGHEPPALWGHHEDSSRPHEQEAPKEDRKDSPSPASPPVQTPESRGKGVVGSPPGSSSEQSSASPSAMSQLGPVVRPELATDPSDICPINLQTANPEQGVKDGSQLDLGADDDPGTNSLPPVLHTWLSSTDTHSSEAGSSVPVSSPESLHHLGHTQAATAARTDPGLLPSSPSTPPALSPVEELGPEQPTGMTSCSGPQASSSLYGTQKYQLVGLKACTTTDWLK